jgi:hydroxymethylbilane synthase
VTRGGDRVLRLGTRRSALAQAQSGLVARALETAHPGLRVQLVPIVTEGDRRPGDLAPLGGKGLFTRELEEGLERGDLDLAVHSLKDLPARIPEALTLAAFPRREDPRDALVSDAGPGLAALASGDVVLTGSQRRRAQILALRPDVRVEPLRGNVETRLRKWRHSGARGTILAMAGLSRLGLEAVPAHPLEPAEMIPAPGQGVLAVQTRKGTEAEALCRLLDHPATALAARSERAVVRAFGGDCTLPLAALAEVTGDTVRLRALLATPDGTRLARGEAVGRNADDVAAACLEAMRDDGADDVLRALGRPDPA